MGQGMFDSPRWRVIVGIFVAAASVGVVAAPPARVDASAGCFSISVTNDLRMGVTEIDEASGLVLSRQMPGVMWTHNDDDPGAGSTANNRIYAVDESGDLLATVQFNMDSGLATVPGSKFVELEDIAFGPGPGGDPNWLYLADTGDNNPTREYVSIYRFQEPVFTPDPDNPITINVDESELDGTRFQYQSYINPSEIKARNVEAVIVDPRTGHVYLFEKGQHAFDENGDLADATSIPKEWAFVYRVPESDLFPSDTTEMQLARVVSYVKVQFEVTTTGITAADIAADGSIIAVKNRDETFYWVRDPNESVVATFENDHISPCLAPTGMKGEGLAIDPINGRMVMIREGLFSPIWQAVFDDPDYSCFGRPATILGTGGDDVINGTAGADVIMTFGGDDQVKGKNGKDRICLGPGADSATGGKKVDRIDGGWGADDIEGGDGADILWGRDGRDTLAGNAGADIIYGGEQADDIAGGAGADALWGMAGRDSILGKSDADVMNGGNGSDVCDGGAGTDVATSCEDVAGVP